MWKSLSILFQNRVASLPLPHGSPVSLWIVLTENRVFFILIHLKVIEKNQVSCLLTKYSKTLSSWWAIHAKPISFPSVTELQVLNKEGSNQCKTHLDFTKALGICKALPLMSQGYQAWTVLLQVSMQGHSMLSEEPGTTYTRDHIGLFQSF